MCKKNIENLSHLNLVNLEIADSWIWALRFILHIYDLYATYLQFWRNQIVASNLWSLRFITNNRRGKRAEKYSAIKMIIIIFVFKISNKFKNSRYVRFKIFYAYYAAPFFSPLSHLLDTIWICLSFECSPLKHLDTSTIPSKSHFSFHPNSLQ